MSTIDLLRQPADEANCVNTFFFILLTMQIQQWAETEYRDRDKRRTREKSGMR